MHFNPTIVQLTFRFSVSLFGCGGFSVLVQTSEERLECTGSKGWDVLQNSPVRLCAQRRHSDAVPMFIDVY